MEFNVYWALIAASVVVILSYFFNALARQTNVPSVLMLIVTGFLISFMVNFDQETLRPTLETLGTIGLVMIVLEAALDLHLERKKAGLIGKALIISLILLISTTFGIAMIMKFFFEIEQFEALVYAIPLSIMSSAIIIPSVANLIGEAKEFLVIESAFSDILGIMLFYFILDTVQLKGFGPISLHVVQNIGLTFLIAVAFGYLIIIFIQKVTGEVKLFLPIAVLVLLYATGKLFHLSSLMFVLAFGLMLNNVDVFFKGFLKRFVIPDAYQNLLSEIKLITLESSFLIRTFFFIVFGMSITLDGFNQISVFIIAILALVVMYLLRWVTLRVVIPSLLTPAVYVAPRGLITILLFYSIPAQHVIPEFSPAILFLVIISSNLIMMYGLIRNSQDPDKTPGEILQEPEVEIQIATGQEPRPELPDSPESNS